MHDMLIFALIGLIVGAASTCRSGKVTLIVTSVLGTLFGAVVGYTLQPVLALDFAAVYIVVGLVAAAAAIIVAIVQERFNVIGTSIAGGAFVLLILGSVCTSWGAFHSKAYHDLLGPVKESKFTKDITPVSLDQIRTVSQAQAQVLGDKRIGDIAGLGSRVVLGSMTIQLVDGKLYWVAPLEHSGVTKQWSNGSTPGYIMVSATDQSDVRLVTQLPACKANAKTGDALVELEAHGDYANGNLNLRYFQNGGYFGYNVERHLRNNGYASAGLADYNFEVDDCLHPYWVVTVYSKKVGFSGVDATGVLTVDASTGAIKAYTIKSAPKWIDRIQPEDVVSHQINDWGDYVHGWWNSLFGQNDVLTSTPGMSLVYGADGQAYWYTGIQSKGSDTSTTGFMLINTRTKAVTYYRVVGATEEAAQKSVENAPGAKQYGYAATSPILYNVDGVATYFMSLSGSDNLPKAFAFVSVESYTTYGVGSTPAEALRNYELALGQSKSIHPDGKVQELSVTATVTGVASEALGNTVYYYIRIDDPAFGRKEFRASTDTSRELKWTKPGDKVRIFYQQGADPTIVVLKFDNLGLHLQDVYVGPQ